MRLAALLVSFLTLACTEAPTVAPQTPPRDAVPAPAPAPEPAAGCTPAPDRLCPVDEASEDPSFAAFRAQLVETVGKRDTEALLRSVDPNIRTGFGPGGGIDDFRRQWSLDSADSPLWDELAEILAHGGTFRGEGEGRSFWAPYVYSAWPEEKDAFTHVAALGSDVKIHERREESAPEIAAVDWQILELVMREGWLPDDPRMEVRLPEGRSGWVRAAEVRSPTGWRAGFMKSGGEWRMTAMVAGD